VRLLDFPERRGKAAVLNRSISTLSGEVVLLSDANTLIAPDAVKKLLRWFERPEVSCVCGRLVLTDPATGKNADGLYWKYETMLKRSEARLGALLGANGAIYAIRRDRYEPIPDGTIIDDFVIPLLSLIRRGGSVVYEPDALAFEETAPDVAAEFRRRCRIGAGGFQSLALLWPVLDPRRGWLAFAFFSHKLLRWLGPFFLLGMIAANLALAMAGPPFWRWTLASQALFYTITLLIPPGTNPLSRPHRLMTMFTSMNIALLVGFWGWLTGRWSGIWTPTARPVAATESHP
jgi:cellulose synthase/poly-beta-1,6-N-acetylglucosamine synthase-like glycosyltransferase